MKPIKNKHKVFCGCDLVQRKIYKNGRKAPLTYEQQDQIQDLYEQFYKYCSVNERGECVDISESGHHTEVGIHYIRYCKTCGRHTAEVVPHKAFRRLPSRTNGQGGNYRHLPIPRIRYTTVEDVLEQNAIRDDDWDDFDDYEAEQDEQGWLGDDRRY